MHQPSHEPHYVTPRRGMSPWMIFLMVIGGCLVVGLVLVVPARIYDMAPRGFESLAIEAGAQLVRVQEAALAQVELEYRLMDTLLHALRARERSVG